MSVLETFLANRHFKTSVAETEGAIRFIDVEYNPETHGLVAELNEFLTNNKLGTAAITTELGEADLLKPYNSTFHGKSTVVVQKEAPLYFATELGFRKFLSAQKQLEDSYPIRLCFLKKNFSSLSVTCIPFTTSVNQLSSNDTDISAIKYVKPLNEFSQNLLPSSINQWTIPEDQKQACTQAWRLESTKKLLLVPGSEVLVEDGKLKIEFRGDRSKSIDIPIADDSLLLTNFSIVHSICDWIYLQHRDIDSRHTLFNQQICYLLADDVKSMDADQLNKVLTTSFENCQSAYRYYLLDASKEVQKNLSDLNKNLFEYVTKMRQSATDLATALWKDFAIVLGVMILNFSTKQPEIFKQYFGWFALGLSAYIAINFFMTASSGFWYYAGVKDNLAKWKTKLYSYLSDSEFATLASDPLVKAFDKFKVSFWIALAFYVALIVAIVFLSLRGISNN